MDADRITHLAHLARLTVPEEERTSMTKDIENILSFIDTVTTVTLENKEDGSTDAVNVFRSDEVQAIASDHDLVEAAPLHQDHYVKVPKVLE